MTTIAVVGLGYVGLPLAVEFGKKHRTIGLDLSQAKVEAYRRHVDPTGEVSSADLKAAANLSCTTDAAQLRDAGAPAWSFRGPLLKPDARRFANLLFQIVH